MSAQEIVRFDESEITGMTRYAKAYSQSGFFRDANSIEKAFVAISAGAEIGVPPFAAITGISIIQGKPVIGSGILAGLVKSHPNYDYRVKQLDDDACVIAFFQAGEEIGTSSFSMEDAKRAQLDGKDVWKKFRRNMLFARAISNGVAFYCPDVTNGRMYVEHELDDVPAPRPIASARTAPEPTPTPSSEETIVDVVPEEASVTAAPGNSQPEPSRTETPEGDAAAVTTPTERVKAMLASLTTEERDAVKLACATLSLKATPRGILDAFDEHAFEHDSFLVAISNAVKAHAQADREREEGIAEARTHEQTDEQKAGAAEFDEFLADSEKRWGGGLEAAGKFGAKS